MKFKTIRTKLIVSICSIAIAIIFVLQFINLALLFNAFNTLVPNMMQASLNSAHTQVRAQLDEGFSAISTIAAMPTIQDSKLTLEEKALSLAGFIAQNQDKGYLSCAVSDTEGVAVLSSGFEINVSADPYFTEAIQGKPALSDPFPSVATGKLLVVFAVPYYNEKEELAGVITLDLDALQLSKTFTVDGLGKTGTAFAITKEGYTAVSTDTQAVTNQFNSQQQAQTDTTLKGRAEAESQMLSAKSGDSSFQYNGAQQLLYFAPIEGTSWVLGVTQEESEAFATLNTITIAGVAVLVLAAIFSFGAAWALARSISKPITKLRDAADALALGDATAATALQAHSQDEIGDLTHAFVRMSQSMEEQSKILNSVAQGNLAVEVVPRSQNDTLSNALRAMVIGNNRTLSDVNLVAHQVATGADQIAQSSQQLAESSTQQTMAVAEISEAISMMDTEAKHNLTVAQQASSLSSQVKDHLLSSSQSMHTMVTAMSEIKASSDSIANVIKIIDNIAFQTNILALNASVEAARAGQAGKGFAVVADEVRNLATRSAKAVQETSQLIEASMQKVNDGTQIANTTNDSMEKLTQLSNEILSKVEEIAAASQNQAASIIRVDSGIENINSATHSNSASAEESANSSQALSALARQLNEMIAHYVLTETQNAPHKQALPAIEETSAQDNSLTIF